MKTTILPWVEKHWDKIDWSSLSSNFNATPILEKNLDKVNWNYLSSNINAIPILENNLDKVNWRIMSSNINAIPILEKNQDEIDWEVLCKSPNIFCCDYDYYKKRMDIHREELMKKVFHPRRLAYYLELGYDGLFD